ncbi:hypothetical protein P9112_011347 [Eukaryota sp. TZLM1-RC]
MIYAARPFGGQDLHSLLLKKGVCENQLSDSSLFVTIVPRRFGLCATYEAFVTKMRLYLNIPINQLVSKDEAVRVFKKFRPLNSHCFKIARNLMKESIQTGLAWKSTSIHQSPNLNFEKRKKRSLKGNHSGVDETNTNTKAIYCSLFPRTALFIAKFDLPRNFYQVVFIEEDMPKVAFGIIRNAIEFKCEFIGSKNIPSIFQNLVSNILTPENGSTYLVFVCIDHIVVSAPIFESLTEGIIDVQRCAKNHRVRLYAPKTKIVFRPKKLLLFVQFIKISFGSIDLRNLKSHLCGPFSHDL